MIEQFGLNGDVPAVGDYDGDGKNPVREHRVEAKLICKAVVSNGIASLLNFRFF